MCQIRNYARSTDVRVARVEADLHKLLERSIERDVALLRDRLTQCEPFIESYGVRLDNLTATLEVRAKAKGRSEVIATMRGEIGTLRADVDQLRSTDISMLWGEVPLHDVSMSIPSTMPNSERLFDIADIGVENNTREDDMVDDDLAEEINENELRREEVE
ncbi:uncharacterized protein LOC125837795 [Solanum verrucosum]|uniref:uncharacterized protein LOC125837795 n=1 Tax=Solanum verrucosum TaxID=315347 RepID=UPI0020D10058|nr:uncharacterized protein LOC125837795 [Solanum verrucosum]